VGVGTVMPGGGRDTTGTGCVFNGSVTDNVVIMPVTIIVFHQRLN
jgi:hypothetical protein